MGHFHVFVFFILTSLEIDFFKVYKHEYMNTPSILIVDFSTQLGKVYGIDQKSLPKFNEYSFFLKFKSRIICDF